MEYVKKAKWAYIIISIALIAFGICLMIWPGMSMQTLCIIAGIVIAAFGAIKIFGYFSKDRYGLAFQFDFALGIFAIIAGALMIIHSTNVITALPVICGVFVITDGTFKLQTAVDARRFGLERWWYILVLALLTCLCGVVLVLNPFESMTVLAVAFGITLVVDGIQNLCVVAYTVKNTKSGVIDVKYKEI